MLSLFLILIFCRPFISSLAWPEINQAHSTILIAFLGLWLFKQKSKFHLTGKLAGFGGIFAAAILISIVFSQDKIASIRECYKYLLAIMIFLSCSYLTQKQKKTVADCLVLSGVSIGLAAIYQFFFGFQHTLEHLDPAIQYSQFTMEYLCLKRVFFPFVTPNILAGYLAITIPLCLTLKHGKLIALVPFAALCLTRSIGGLLSLLIGLSVYYYLKGINRKMFLGICAIAVISGLIFVWRSTGTHAHIKPFFSLSMRMDYWEQTLRIIREFPLTGIGIGNFNLAASRYAHNSYLQIWAEMGILGLISILWISADTLKHLVKRIKNSPAQNILYGLAAANAVFLINNVYSFDFFLPEISLIWWAILGLSRE